MPGKSIDQSRIRQLIRQGLNASQIAARTGASRASVWAAMRAERKVAK